MMLRVPGRVLIGTSITTTTGTGGTEISNLEAAEIALETVTIGRERRNLSKLRKPSVVEIADGELVLTMRNVEQQGIDLLQHFYAITGGVSGKANPILSKTQKIVSLLVIPRETSSTRYLYVSRAEVAPDGEPQEIAWSRRKVWFPDGRVRLRVLAPITPGEPPFLVDDATALAAAYTELSA
jgi:hypothetical protein